MLCGKKFNYFGLGFNGEHVSHFNKSFTVGVQEGKVGLNRGGEGLDLGGERTMQCADDVLYSCTLETCMALSTNVSPLHSIKKQ